MNTIVTITISLLLSAFFSGMEIAFVSSNKLLFEIERKKKALTSKVLAIFYKHSEQYITTMLVGNNIVLVVYSLKMAELLEPYFKHFIASDYVVTLLQTIIATILVLFTGEFLPKTIFKSSPNLWLTFFAFPLLFFYILLWPIARFCHIMSIVILRLFKVYKKVDDETGYLNKVDLEHLLKKNMEQLENDRRMEQDVKILQNALDFSSVKLRDCEVPRTEIVACELQNLTLDYLKDVFSETGYSKVLVYKDSIDNIIGYIHTQVIFKNPENLPQYIRPLPIVPETMPANKLLKIFMKKKKNIAVVVDEFGGTAGIITLEDILEEIFGEIEDEHDNREYVAKQLSEKEFLFSGRLNVADINEKFNLNIPESDDYQTLAGYILFEYKNFPRVNDVIVIGDKTFIIMKASRNLIELVRVMLDKK